MLDDSYSWKSKQQWFYFEKLHITVPASTYCFSMLCYHPARLTETLFRSDHFFILNWNQAYTSSHFTDFSYEAQISCKNIISELKWLMQFCKEHSEHSKNSLFYVYFNKQLPSINLSLIKYIGNRKLPVVILHQHEAQDDLGNHLNTS